MTTIVPNLQYLEILEAEKAKILQRFDPHAEGTGHFNTAASVLEQRIQEIRQELIDKKGGGWQVCSN
jgi:hypothetical protein